MTRRCSARVSVGLSPVVPHGTKKLIPASICRRTSLRSVSSSSDRSRRNGVTNAVPHPVNMCHLLKRGLGVGGWGLGNGASYYLSELVEYPLGGPSALRAR